ncbi:MAG: flagellar filament capping protein FliD, partial [Clostridiales bacterium]|nr:flagellar filament capping protein FliD [Clostridiales bacterium]
MAINSIGPTRLFGLASGLDTESLVRSLMRIEMQKLNRELRAKTTLQWRQDALTNVANDLRTFKNTFLTTLGADAMLQSSTYTSFKVDLSGAKKDAVSISANSEATAGQITINKITALASGATAKSAGKVSKDGQQLSENNSARLGDLKFANDLFGDGNDVSFAINGVSFTFNKNTTLQGMMETVNSSAAGVNMTYSRLTDGFSITTKETGADQELKILNIRGNAFGTNSAFGIFASGAEVKSADKVSASGTQLTDNLFVELGDLDFANELFQDSMGNDTSEIRFQLNDYMFTFEKTDTLADMLSRINSSGANVEMTYDRLTDRFTVTSTNDQALTIINHEGNAFGTDSAFGIQEVSGAITTYKGSNAVAYINGSRVERSTNTFRADGVQYTLNYVTGEESAAEAALGLLDTADPANDPANAINILLTKDIDSAFNNIKSFIDGYNVMVRKLNDLLREKKDTKYYALTEEEKAEMTEKQIEQWEGYAKSGLLRNDRDIQRLLDNMRAAFYSTVEGAGLSPQQIGLRTGSYLDSEGKYNGGNGEISINESLLRAALEKDSDQVMRVFMGGVGSNNPAEKGLIYRLTDVIDTYISDTQYITMY